VPNARHEEAPGEDRGFVAEEESLTRTDVRCMSMF
jgi:hypothetical protein